MEAFAALVVDDFVGLDGGAVVIDLDVAGRGYQQVVVVVSDLIGLHEHLGIGGRLGGDTPADRLRPDLVLESQKAWKLLRLRRPGIRQHPQRRG
jgi:hypothetical protein